MFVCWCCVAPAIKTPPRGSINQMEEELVEKVRRLGYTGIGKKDATFSKLKDEEWMSMFSYLIRLYEPSLTMETQNSLAGAHKQLLKNMRVLDLAHQVPNADQMKQKRKLAVCVSGLIDKLESKHGDMIYNPSQRPKIAAIRYNFSGEKENDEAKSNAASVSVAAPAPVAAPVAAPAPAPLAARKSLAAKPSRLSTVTTVSAAAAAAVAAPSVSVAAKSATKVVRQPRPPVESFDMNENLISSGKQLARTPPRAPASMLKRLQQEDQDDMDIEQEESKSVPQTLNMSMVDDNNMSMISPANQNTLMRNRPTTQTRARARASMAPLPEMTGEDAEAFASRPSKVARTPVRKSETFAPMSSMAEPKITPAVASSARALRFAAPLDFEDSELSTHSVPLPVAPTPKNAEIAMPVKSTPLHKQLELQQQQLEQLQQMQLEMQQQLDSNNNAHEEHAEEVVPRRISKATQQRRASKAAKAAAVIEEEEEREKEAEAKSSISNARAAAISAVGLVPSNLSASMMDEDEAEPVVAEVPAPRVRPSTAHKVVEKEKESKAEKAEKAEKAKEKEEEGKKVVKRVSTATANKAAKRIQQQQQQQQMFAAGVQAFNMMPMAVPLPSALPVVPWTQMLTQLPAPMQAHLNGVDQQLAASGFDAAQREVQMRVMVQTLFPFMTMQPAVASAVAAPLVPMTPIMAPLPTPTSAASAVVPPVSALTVQVEPTEEHTGKQQSRLRAPQVTTRSLISPVATKTDEVAVEASTQPSVAVPATPKRTSSAMKSPAGKRNARLTRTPVGKAAVAAMMRERPSPIDDEMPDALDLAPNEAPTAPAAPVQPTVARQLAVELAVSAAPEPKLITPTYAQIVAKKAPIISPAPPPVVAAQVTAPAGWESLAHVKNMELRAQALADTAKQLASRDTNIAKQLERMEADLNVMVTAYDGSSAAGVDMSSQTAALRDKVLALAARHRTTAVTEAEVSDLQMQLLSQFDAQRAVAVDGRARVQASLDEMATRFRDLRIHLEQQAAARTREVEAIRKYNKRLQAAMGSVSTAKSPGRSPARMFSTSAYATEETTSAVDSKQSLRRVQQFLDRFNAKSK